MSALFIVLVFYVVIFTLTKFVTNKFGANVIRKFVKYSILAFYLISFFVIYFYIPETKILDKFSFKFVNVLISSLVPLIFYLIFIIGVPYAIYDLVDNIATGRFKKNFLQSEFVEAITHSVTRPSEDTTSHERWMWTLSKLVSLILTPTILYFIFIFISMLSTYYAFSENELLHFYRNVPRSIPLIVFGFIVLIYAAIFLLIGLFGMIARLVYFILK